MSSNPMPVFLRVTTATNRLEEWRRTPHTHISMGCHIATNVAPNGDEWDSRCTQALAWHVFLSLFSYQCIKNNLWLNRHEHLHLVVSQLVLTTSMSRDGHTYLEGSPPSPLTLHLKWAQMQVCVFSFSFIAVLTLSSRLNIIRVYNTSTHQPHHH